MMVYIGGVKSLCGLHLKVALAFPNNQQFSPPHPVAPLAPARSLRCHPRGVVVFREVVRLAPTSRRPVVQVVTPVVRSAPLSHLAVALLCLVPARSRFGEFVPVRPC